MKAIIDWIQYDTEKAEAVASYHNGLSCNDPYYENETLYVGVNGHLFFAGEGGSQSRYVDTLGNGCRVGSGVCPVNRMTAIAWLEYHGQTRAIAKHFPHDIIDA